MRAFADYVKIAAIRLTPLKAASMSSLSTEPTLTTCANHPERAAVESCEVCLSPLCAYCLYYTSDGQRLCKTHAEQAAAAGAFIRAPGTYAGQLIGAQLEASRNQITQRAAYEGDAVDVLALVGMVLGIVSIMLCVPGVCCLVGPVGMIFSVVALVGAKNAHDPSRTRTMAGIGALLSAMWILVILICVISYAGQTSSGIRMLNLNNLPITVIAPQFGQPVQLTDTPTAAATTLP